MTHIHPSRKRRGGILNYMEKNSLVLFFVAVFLGLSNGLYLFLYPYFLDSLGISFRNMGIIFSVAALVIAVLGVILGWLSDLSGRKKYYALSLFLASLTTMLTPVLRRIGELLVTKIVRDTATSIRAALHPTLLFDYTRKGFTRLLAQTQGLTSLMAALGTFLSAFLLVFGFPVVFLVSGTIILLASIVFAMVFSEKPRKTQGVTWKGLRKAFTWDIPRNLKFIAGSSGVFTLGNQLSHSFIMPLFFSFKFNLSPASVALIMSLHRLSAGLPMILGASFVFQNQDLVRKHLKTIALGSLLYQGLMIAICGFSPKLWLAIIGWLAHDIFGPPLRIPSQGTLIQRYSAEETRGRDTNIVNAFGKVGGIFAPFITGILASIDISLPVILSGLTVMTSPTFYIGVKDRNNV